MIKEEKKLINESLKLLSNLHLQIREISKSKLKYSNSKVVQSQLNVIFNRVKDKFYHFFDLFCPICNRCLGTLPK